MPKLKSTTGLRLEGQLRRSVEKLAKEEKRSLSAMMRILLEEAVTYRENACSYNDDHMVVRA